MSRTDSFFNYYQAHIKLFTRMSSGLRFFIQLQPIVFFSGCCVSNLSRYKQISRKQRMLFRTRHCTQQSAVRVVDTSRRCNIGVPGYIRRIEYLPQSTTFVSLVLFSNNTVMYHTTYTGAFVFARIHNLVNSIFRSALVQGDSCILYWLMEGTVLFNMELLSGCGSQYLRSAGMHGMLLRRFFYANCVLVRLRFSIRCIISMFCMATIGICANSLSRNKKYSTAGFRQRTKCYPIVRGVAMNPVDHPHGGGNGHKSKKANPRSIFGKSFKWRKTSRAQQLAIVKYFLLRY